MRSRWFHAPVLHSPLPGSAKKPSWLELFYDLIFVAAVIELGGALSRHVTVEGFAAFAGTFAPLWLAWTSFTFYSNRFGVDDFLHRGLVFGQMFAIGAVAVSAPGVLEAHPAPFAFAYATVQLFLCALYVRTLRQVGEARDLLVYYVSVYTLGAVLWAVSGWTPAPWTYVVWAIAIGLGLSFPVNRRSRTLALRYPPDVGHMSERYGLLTVIVLGEAFVKVLSALAEHRADVMTILQACFALLITCCLWWIYFDDIAGAKIKAEPGAAFVWVYSHLPLTLGVTATAVGIKKAVGFDLGAVAPVAYRWLLAGSLALAFASVALIDSVTERLHAELHDRARSNVRSLSALALLLLAPAGGAMTAGVFLGLVMTICIAQVVFDLMMAPLVFEPHGESFPTTAELARRRLAGDASGPRSRIGEAVRKGIPSELRKDFYFFYMQGPWSRLLLTLAFVYVMANVFFASLYLLEPASIANARPDSFADAFFFSVQTFSTIGYGAMAPKSAYGNVIVTIEAGFALLGVAMATGLMFAKAARPRSSVLFSDCMVLTRRNGRPVLVFRVGNARGNEVVDATMTVTALIEEISPEGDHMRRLHDLSLLRSRSPFFTMTWVVIHELDETSPLHDFDWDPARLVGIIATLIGHDATYGQTTHARHMYYATDVRRGHRFVDIISQLDDGRLLIDYTKFHDTEPDAVSAAVPAV